MAFPPHAPLCMQKQHGTTPHALGRQTNKIGQSFYPEGGRSHADFRLSDSEKADLSSGTQPLPCVIDPQPLTLWLSTYLMQSDGNTGKRSRATGSTCGSTSHFYRTTGHRHHQLSPSPPLSPVLSPVLNSQLSMAELLTQQTPVERLENEVSDLRSEVRHLRAEVDRLVAMIQYAPVAGVATPPASPAGDSTPATPLADSPIDLSQEVAAESTHRLSVDERLRRHTQVPTLTTHSPSHPNAWPQTHTRPPTLTLTRPHERPP